MDTLTDKLTPDEIAEYRALKEKEDFANSGIREVEGRLKCPACLHTESVQLTEYQLRRYPTTRDRITGELGEDRDAPPENITSQFRRLNDEDAPVHDCEANSEGQPMMILPPDAQSVFKDPRAERHANERSRRALDIGDDITRSAAVMEKAFAAMFERAREGK